MLLVPLKEFELENKDFLIWITLFHMRQIDAEVTCVTPDTLSWNMYGEIASDSVKYKDFTIAKKYGNKVSGGAMIIDNSQFDLNEGEHFARIDYGDVQKITRSEFKNKLFLVKYYCWLMQSRNNKTDVGNMPLKYFANKLDCSERTLINCNKQLEELGVLYVNHTSDVKKKKDGTLSSTPNVYGRIDKKAEIDDQMNARSIGNKIAWMRKGKKYSDEEAQEMYNYIIACNKQLLENKKKNQNYAGELKDITIFDGYNIVRDEEYEMFN